MSVSIQGKSLEQTIAAIQALDLTPIKLKSTRKEGGYSWSPEYANQMEIAYKRYLILHAKHPERLLAPDEDVDRFWHLHILDTRKYAADCEATFGHFVHHFPYLGLRDENDEAALAAAFADMQRLHAQEFGIAGDRPQDVAWCSVEPTKVSPAWCSIEPTRVSPAWCSVEPTRVARVWEAREHGESQAVEASSHAA